jgi:hypothetical protein
MALGVPVTREKTMQTLSKPSVSHFAIISCLLIGAFCGLGWIWQTRKSRDQIQALELKNREFDDRQRRLEAEIFALKEKFDAVQLALIEIDHRFMGQNFRFDEPEFASSLPITIGATGDGQVSSLNVGVSKLFDGPLDTSRLETLDRRLSDVFNIEGKPFDRFLLRIGGSLRFDELLKILVVCSRQNMADGTAVNRVGFLRMSED